MEASVPPSLPAADPAAWLPRATAALRAGGIVALPTETFYGLAVDPRRRDAVSGLLALKGHPVGRPVLLLAASPAQVDGVARLSRMAADLARRFWPGPLTLVLPARQDLPACPGGTVAVRVPASDPPRRLAEALGSPITGTSANRAGWPPATRAARVREAFPEGLALLVDGGPTPGGLPSTLLDLAAGCPRLLREGAVAAAAIEACLGISLPAPGSRP